MENVKQIEALCSSNSASNSARMCGSSTFCNASSGSHGTELRLAQIQLFCA
ncbi:conserved hypothetical protein, partial [Trichinella spiralis]|uniref:hypothetical protein n=1 Tax=Trichinella spiralis TaxID=6334 RepID=UPI0001EFD9CB